MINKIFNNFIYALILLLFWSCNEGNWNLKKKPEITNWTISAENKNKVKMEIEVSSDSDIKESKLLISKNNFITFNIYDLDIDGEKKKITYYLENEEKGIYTAKIILENDLGKIGYRSGQNSFSFGIEHSIGDSYQGGVIAYLLKEGDVGYDPQKQKGLIITNESFDRTTWGCRRNISETKTLFGFGAENTSKIIETCNRSNSASGVCYNYTKNGYDDWFLPSFDEMKKIYKYIDSDVIYFNQAPAYWTSSQENRVEALMYHPNCEVSSSCIIPKNSLAFFVPTRYMK